jgi:hypothetical protein
VTALVACEGGVVTGGADGVVKLWTPALEQLKIYDMAGQCLTAFYSYGYDSRLHVCASTYTKQVKLVVSCILLNIPHNGTKEILLHRYIVSCIQGRRWSSSRSTTCGQRLKDGFAV